MPDIFSAGFSPSHDCAIIIACDANYLPYAAVPALQLSAIAGRDFDVLIGSPDAVTLPRSLQVAGIGNVAARDSDLENALPLDARRSLATYMEVFLARALAPHYRRILVLDADVLVERGNPGPLLQADMGGRAVAAVRDNRQWRTPNRRTDEFRKLGRPATPYFNAGVVMIDTGEWARQDLSAEAAEFARVHLAGLGRDQALMNGMLNGDWAEMSPVWNWQFTWSSAELTGTVDPCIIHFIGPRKPWLADAAGIVPDRYRTPYAALPDDVRPANLPDMTRRHVPDATQVTRRLFKQWRGATATLRLLSR
ncbi:MAG: hypothetical protein DI498_07495, partial [Paracoccus denitrificans]